MADDIKIKLGLDATDLFTGLDQALSKVNADIRNLPDVGDAIAADIPKANAALKSFIDEQKQLLIILRLQGKEGSDSYAQIERSIIDARTELDKFEQASKDVEASIKGIGDAGQKSGGLLSNLKSEISNAGGLGAGLVGGIAGGLATAGIGTAISAVQGLGTAIFDGAMRADEFGDKLEVAFSQQGIADVEGEINKVRESTLQLANDLGLPTQRTRELAGTVATLGGVSGKQAEDLTKLSAGIETFTDGTVKGEAVVKAFSRGLADPEGAAAIESLSKKYPQLADTLKSTLSPTEKLAAANKILGTSFETVKNQQADAGGTFNKLSNSVSEAFETIGSGLNNAINVLIPIFTETLGPAFSTLGNTISGLFTRIWSVLEPILGLIGGGIMVNVVGIISVAVEALNSIYETATYAFDQIMIALAPVFDAIKSAFGMDGAVGEGVDAMQIMQGVLDIVTGAIGALFDVVSEIGKVLVDVFVGALKLVIEGVKFVVEGIKSFIFFIGDLISKIPGVQAVFNNLKTAFDAVYNFFSDLPRAINEVQVYLKAFGYVFQGIFSILSDSFDRIKNLDFSGAKESLNQLFDSRVWSGLFADGQKRARTELKATSDAAKKASEEITKTLDPVPPKPPKPPKGTPQETESDLQELKRLYADYAQYLQNNEAAILQDFKGTAEERKNEEARLSKERAQKLKEYLNTQLADVKDFNANLSSEQLALKIKPDKAKKEDFEDIRSFYLGETSKLSKDLNLEVKVKLPDFKDELKGFETAVKDIEKNTEALIPKVLANSQEALDANTSQVTKYLDFIKSQNAEIEQAKTEALASGNIEAAESFDAQIQRNVLSINTLTSRLATYQTDSSKAIAKAEEESTLAFQLTTALQTNILDAFNSERIAKEREANEAIRAEKLGALDQEENDLTTSLAKREVSFEEYAAKMADIDKARQDAMEATEIDFGKKIKGALDKTVGAVLQGQAKAITTFVTKSFTETGKEASESTKIIGAAAGQLATQFGALAASGQATLRDFAAASVDIALTALNQMVPIFIAEITGKQFAELGIAGIAAAAGLTIILNGLVMQARASAGFKDGVVDLAGPGTETSDSIPAWLSKGESVITASSTRANKEELAWMNNNPGMSIRDYFTSHAPQVRYSVGEDGGLIREVQKLREETRGLGRQINRNTHVSISGELRADNNSIKAVIDNERRRNARRG